MQFASMLKGKSMMYDWEIVACLQYPDGELLDKSKPFKTYHVEAETMVDAVNKLKEDFNMCNVTIGSKPVAKELSREAHRL